MNLAKNCLIAMLLLFASQFVLAHSGGTNAYGCHYDHKTYTYHCH